MNPNNYEKQKERAISRKYELVESKGGKCEICGYDKNYAAFDFHHINPKEKSFKLDSRVISNTNIIKLKKEVEKCMLLCANCHREIHYGELDKEKVFVKINDVKTKHISINNKSKKRQSVCKFCNCEYDFVKGKVYCNNECRRNDKKYPTIEEVTKKYNELNNWEKVADFFNLTRRVLQGIRKLK